MRPSALVFLLALLCAPAVAETEDEWVLTFENGDSIHCRLEALADGKLTVRWTVAPEETVRLDLKAVAYVVRAGEEEPDDEPPDDLDTLRLVDDSVLYGRAVEVRPDGIEFEVPDVGRLRIGAASILHLARGPVPVDMPAAEEGEFGVALKSGSRLAGKLNIDDRGRLVLEGNGFTASIDYESLSVLVFPPPAVTISEEEGPPQSGAQIRLRNGSILGGKQPRIADGVFHVRVGEGEAGAKLGDVVAIAFRDNWMPLGRVGKRAVFVWGRWSDIDDEYQKTWDILQKELGPSWKLVKNTASEYDDEFRRELFSCGTMVIPEMESLNRASPDAAELKPLLESFVRSGGNVIICGVQSQHCDWIRAAGLFDLQVTGGVDGKDISLTAEGARLGKGLGSFTAMNATFAYKVKNRDAVSLAETESRTVVAGRRIGRGWMICIGLDYYLTNDGASKLLAAAVQMR